MTNPTPPGQVPEALPAIQRFEVVDCIDSKHVPAVIPKPHGPWVRYEDHAAALCPACTQRTKPSAPSRTMPTTTAQAAESVPAGAERAAFEANWCERNHPVPLNSRLRDDGRYGDHLIQSEWEAWQASAARAPAESVWRDAEQKGGA